MMGNSITKPITGLLVLCVLAIGLFIGRAFHERDRAAEFLRTFSGLRLDESGFAEVEVLAKSYGGKPWSINSENVSCSPQSCVFRFVFQNNLVHFVPRLPSIQLTASLTIRDGRLTARELDYQTSGPKFDGFTYLLLDSVERSPAEYGVRRRKVDVEGIPHVLEIRLGPRSGTDDNQCALAVDTSCLARLSGCESPESVFPRGWEKW